VETCNGYGRRLITHSKRPGVSAGPLVNRKFVDD
jgi:hypothetical protein